MVYSYKIQKKLKSSKFGTIGIEETKKEITLDELLDKVKKAREKKND